MCSDKSEILPEAKKAGREIITKNHQLSWTIRGYKENGTLAARHTSVSALLLSSLT